jgi:hypothetical protein
MAGGTRAARTGGRGGMGREEARGRRRRCGAPPGSGLRGAVGEVEIARGWGGGGERKGEGRRERGFGPVESSRP